MTYHWLVFILTHLYTKVMCYCHITHPFWVALHWYPINILLLYSVQANTGWFITLPPPLSGFSSLKGIKSVASQVSAWFFSSSFIMLKHCADSNPENPLKYSCDWCVVCSEQANFIIENSFSPLVTCKYCQHEGLKCIMDWSCCYLKCAACTCQGCTCCCEFYTGKK